MTTTVGPNVTDGDGARTRLLSLVADLTPPEVGEKRRLARVRLIVLASLGTVLVVLAAWFAVSSWQAGRQQTALAAAETEAIGLRQQQRQYSELINAQAQSTRIDTQLATLLKTDVQWATLLGRLRAAAPRGLSLSSLAIALTDPTTQAAGSSAASAASGLPANDGKTPIGSLTVSGDATTTTAIAGYVDAVAEVPGVGNVLLSGVNDEGGTTNFTLRADLRSTLFSNHYAVKAD